MRLDDPTPVIFRGREVLADPDVSAELRRCPKPAHRVLSGPDPCESCGEPVVLHERVASGERFWSRITYTTHGVNGTGRPHSACTTAFRTHTPQDCRAVRG